jgi:hypothetical protein
MYGGVSRGDGESCQASEGIPDGTWIKRRTAGHFLPRPYISDGRCIGMVFQLFKD